MADRRDNKNRKLWKGEYQRKDGRYVYKYTDINGKNRFIYSWTLTQNDRTPAGKTQNKCLRELEKEIEKDLLDNINSYDSKNITLNTMFENYIACKFNIKESTRSRYKFMYNKYILPKLGYRKIETIKYTDIKNFYFNLVSTNKLALSSINTINAILKPIFEEALKDGLIRMNPTIGVFIELRKNNPNTERIRHALTECEQRNLLDYIRKTKKYRKWDGLFTCLLGTGCRIGEMLGLTWNDCDFENNIISINHSLTIRNKPDIGQSRMYISTPKTQKSVRLIPMLSAVRTALLEIKQKQIDNQIISPIIDNYTNFVFLNRNNNIYDYSGINQSIKNIIQSYNKQEMKIADLENRNPILLPKFSVHNLRHTFCTRFCKNETNLKVIQEIMGHSSIKITMDIYNEINTEQKLITFSNLEGKIGI